MKTTISSFCAHGGCVEVEFVEARVLIHGNPPDRWTLSYTRDEWSAFIAGVKAGEFDLDVLAPKQVGP